MKLLNILTTSLITACSVTAFGNPTTAKSVPVKKNIEVQSTTSHRSAHLAAHRELFSNAKKSYIDRSVLSEFIIDDIRKREESVSLSSESSQMLDDLLAEARTHIGKRYCPGSKGPSSFDCSGFSSYVYRQFGYNISPSSRDQYKYGKPVDRNNLRKGDLVFFTSRSSGGAVGHVGIVVSADNEKGTFKFIHASLKGVKISDYEGYYVRTYIGAKRIVEE
ncbi:MAG: C40 family peptidase [Muribaculaceae bacterium]|nr:C40 family peptidase [Muribaculaceae bacterium]